MTFRSKAAAFLGYRTIPTTIITVLSYLAILLALRITDKLEDVPKPHKQGGLNITEAYHDLQMITAQPHPYNSHANDVVHDYILGRVIGLANEYPGVEVILDNISNVTFATGAPAGIYFEGTNILVKIEGKDDNYHTTNASDIETGSVLFSAHYDSVSTAAGVTDDGMGVVTLLQLIRYFAEHRQRRTAVFNINNGEEDGLNGAHAFLEHPWAKLCDSFLNLEGAAAGGRPILFRATSTAPVRALRNVAHPHSNVLSADAFSRGVIRSGTDYSVYTGLDAHPRGMLPSLQQNDGQETFRMSDPRGGMAGLDLAFYKGRSRYHTKYDSSQYTLGGERSLWAMMDAARGIGEGLLSVPLDKGARPDGKRIINGDQGVWFDLFKWQIIVFKLNTLLTWNIILLVMGPILLALLVFTERFFLLQRRPHDHTSHEGNNSQRPVVAGSQPSTVPGNAALNPEGTGQAQESSHPHLWYFSRHSTSSVPRLNAGAPASEINGATTIPPVHVNHDLASGNGHGHGHTGTQKHWALEYTDNIWNHAKFWFALAVVAGLLAGLTAVYVAINPFSVYSSPYVILFSFISLAYLGLVYTITFPAWVPFYHSKYGPTTAGSLNPMQEHKQAIFLHLYVFTWILLVIATVGITRVDPGVAGGYLITIWNGLLLIACALCVLEGLTTRQYSFEGTGEYPAGSDDGELPRRSHRHVEDAGVEADERTPLIWHGANEGRAPEAEEDSHESLGTWWWLPQFLVSVPIPVILSAQVVMLLLDAMPQSLADGGKPLGVYIVTALPAIFIVLPLAPFADKLRPYRLLSMSIGLLLVLTTLYAWLRFPFDIKIPLKVYFQQRVVLPADRINGSSLVNVAATVSVAPIVKTALSGPEMYVRDLIPYLPSARGQTPLCEFESLRSGLLTCEWDSSSLMPSPGRVAPPPGAPPGRRPRPDAAPVKWAKDELLKASVERTSGTTAQITVRGQNTRNCRVYFESHAIADFNIWTNNAESEDDLSLGRRLTPHGEMQEGYEIGPNGVNELRLWSRSWDREFGLDVDWRSFANKTSPSETLRGRISCNWNEYESALVGNIPRNTKLPNVQLVTVAAAKDTASAKVPAYEEALTFLPDWVTLTKYTDGLVEAWAPFAI
ncbi:hypothetical protein D9619_002200 [Psilocybe cf. subviscida]|uniref:Peptide hydrolase n=1 Tax=Psilocybe cf. subviscida TaxID=2480587 RepID=A0A8H5BFS3_9AGAR|nr:hypothetical protein D9619_002200 [Psilocybe cf. subviscida]